MSSRRSRSACLGLLAPLVFIACRLGLPQLEAPQQEQAAVPPPPGSEYVMRLMVSEGWVIGLMVVIACYKVCEVEKVPDNTPVPFDQRDDYARITYMNAYLALMSGIVNAVAFLEMGMTVSHHTGNTTHTGRTWGDGGTRFLGLILAFMLGSGVVGANVIDTEAWIKQRYCPPLMASAVAVASGMFLKGSGGSTMVSLQLLSFSQGILNAVSRKCTAMPICCSHVTGYATDAGAILGSWVSASMNEEEKPKLRKPAIFIISMITFALGGFAAAQLQEQLGVKMLAIPAAGTALAAMGVV